MKPAAGRGARGWSPNLRDFSRDACGEGVETRKRFRVLATLPSSRESFFVLGRTLCFDSIVPSLHAMMYRSLSYLPVFEARRALLQKRRHPLFAIMSAERRVVQRLLVHHACLKMRVLG